MSRGATGIASAVALIAAATIAPLGAAQAAPAPSAPLSAPTAAATAIQVDRLQGESPAAVAAQVSSRWTGPVQRVYVVAEARWQEMLVAAAMAGREDAPLLLSGADRIPADTARALRALSPRDVVVVGKSSAVSDSVLTQLRGYARSGSATRVAGWDRYSTAVQVSASAPRGVDRVVLASGEHESQTLAAAALAGATGAPLLLTEPGVLRDDVARELRRLAPREVMVVGGETAVSTAVARAAAAYSTTGAPVRLAGRDRYETAGAVAATFGPVAQAYVASGERTTDALVLSALAGRDGSPVVLTGPTQVPAASGAALAALSPDRITVAGSPASVSQDVLTALSRVPSSPAPTRPVEPEPDPQPQPTPTPPTSGFPDERTTGVPAGVTLSPSGGMTITQDGTVVDGRHVRGEIRILADNVTIRNSLVQTATSASPIYVDRGTTGTLIEDVEIDNLGGGGLGVFMRGSGVIRRADIHSAEDGIRINSDDVTVEDSYVHDMVREEGGHHDSLQIRRGDDVTIRGNNFQSYVAATRDPQNAAIQIGSLSGDDQISNLLVVGNLMNGGNFTINGGGRWEVDSARYADNRFGRDFRYGVVGNLQNSVWEDTNVWHDTGEPVG